MAAIHPGDPMFPAHPVAHGLVTTAKAASLVAVCMWATVRGLEEGLGIWVRRAARTLPR